MRTNVTIEQWAADGGYVYCHVDDFDGINSYMGDCLKDISVHRFVELALSTDRLREVAGKYSLRGSCRDLCSIVSELRDYSDKQIATARGQLEDQGADEKFTDNEVVWLDYEARDILAGEAREVDNPFDTKSLGVEQMLSMEGGAS